MSTWDALFGTELTLLACIARIMVSFCIGSILGVERRMRQHILGMRTLILICVSFNLWSQQCQNNVFDNIDYFPLLMSYEERNDWFA